MGKTGYFLQVSRKQNPSFGGDRSRQNRRKGILERLSAKTGFQRKIGL